MSLSASAQSKDEQTVLAKTDLLQSTVFGTKDSAMLDTLFAKTLHYEHSAGKVETREQALHGVAHNKSVYDIKTLPDAPQSITKQGDSIIVKKQFQATENKVDGTAVPLDFTVTTIWIKEDGNWKLTYRKAEKNKH